MVDSGPMAGRARNRGAYRRCPSGACLLTVAVVIAITPLFARQRARFLPPSHRTEFADYSQVIQMVAAIDETNGDLGVLWRKLGISPRIRFVTSKGLEEGSHELDCLLGCRAESLDTRELLFDGRTDIIRVCTRQDIFCRFLLFRREEGGPRIIDYADYVESKYRTPEAEVIQSGDGRWLVLTGSAGGGTGVSLHISEWYELRDAGKLVPVLSIAAQGHDVGADPGRIFWLRFVRQERVPDAEVLKFVAGVEFRTKDAGKFLWQEERIIAYSRASAARRFQFDQSRSEIPRDLARNLLSYDSLTIAQFFEFASDRLLVIARTPRDSRRPWLRSLLNKAPASQHTSRLRAALVPD